MLGKILGGFLGPVSQQSPATVEQENVKSAEIGQQPQQDSAESTQGARSNAFERMSETEISSRMLASRLNSRLDLMNNKEMDKKPEEDKSLEAMKAVSIARTFVAISAPVVVSLDWNEIAPLEPDADSDPASRVTTESSDQKESLLPK